MTQFKNKKKINKKHLIKYKKNDKEKKY